MGVKRFLGIQVVTRGDRGMQGGDKGLKAVTRGDKGSQGIRESDKK